MARRIHLRELRLGQTPLDPAQAHHLRDVLRLTDGSAVEVFDDAGATAPAVLHLLGDGTAAVSVENIVAAAASGLRWTVASAVPKGERADWMVEKLSELGATAFIPLATARSVVLPEGKNKRERWERLATESARQSRRAGVMRIEELTPLAKAVAGVRGRGWFLATEVPGIPIAEAISDARDVEALTLFIGPEGGWTAQEIATFTEAGMTPVKLTGTVLRVETAAVAAGAVVASLCRPNVADRT
ncbi:MAG TPA: RsmE family RNA methyltransferase [Tepidisphaeraceae bacterium]|nr:RsmE family RNA methyltransferase [Tepidisphaeraceae bacterium]